MTKGTVGTSHAGPAEIRVSIEVAPCCIDVWLLEREGRNDHDDLASKICHVEIIRCITSAGAVRVCHHIYMVPL